MRCDKMLVYWHRVGNCCDGVSNSGGSPWVRISSSGLSSICSEGRDPFEGGGELGSDGMERAASDAVYTEPLLVW